MSTGGNNQPPGLRYQSGSSLAWFMVSTNRLYPHGVEPVGHTHAFDDYCAPFQTHYQKPDVIGMENFFREARAAEIIARCATGMFLTTGLDLARWGIVLPGSELGGIALVGLLAMSVFGCYIYYPEPREFFDEMKMVNAEVASAAP
ncbi:MAG: hypothetical protein R3C99_07265 [Pirellulaceae bacterium]